MFIYRYIQGNKYNLRKTIYVMIFRTMLNRKRKLSFRRKE